MKKVLSVLSIFFLLNTNYSQAQTVDNVGGIVGYISDTLILNTVTHKGDISGRDSVGGFAGNVSGVFNVTSSSIGIASTSINISGRNNIGGFAGFVNGKTTIMTSNSYSNISASGNNIGGMCGTVLNETSITSSDHSGTIVGTGNTSQSIGGVAGSIYEKLTLNTVNHISGDISGKNKYIGGFVGDVEGILNVIGSSVGTSTSNVVISGTSEVGGFAGYVNGVINIDTSHSYSNIEIDENNGGGLCGLVMETASITRSKHIGTVTGNESTSDNIGGVAGNINGALTLDRTTHSGKLKGKNNIGGLVGNVGEICKITGISNGNTVFADSIIGKEYVGGLVGKVTDTTIIKSANCTAAIALSTDGQYGGGLCGQVGGYTEIANTTHTGSITGSTFLGGAVGEISENFKVDGVHHKGDITGGYNIGGFGGHIEKGVTFVNTSSSRAKISSSGNNAGGLFGHIEGECHIRDNTTFFGTVAGVDYVGGFIGLAGGPVTISNVSQKADSITGEKYIGGFIGSVVKTVTIDSAYIIGNLKATSLFVGGMIGSHSGESLVIKRSYYEGDSIVGADYTGGFVGNAVSVGATTIDSCYTHIKTIKSSGNYVGGLVGQSGPSNVLTIKNCFNDGDRTVGKGTITGKGNYVGGLVGIIQNANSSITSSFNRSHINGTQYVGGLVGGFYRGGSQITYSYNTGNVAGVSSVGGIIGRVRNTITLKKVYNIGFVSGKSSVGAIANSSSGLDAMDCYTVHCVVENGATAYNGKTVRADVMSSESFANTTLGSPFRHEQYSLPKLPMTNHLFVGVVSDSLDEYPIYCAYDISKNGDTTITFSDPIVRLKDNDQKIKVYPSKSYSMLQLMDDHLITPYYLYELHGTVFPFVKTDDLSFDKSFVVTAALYAVPDASANTSAKKIRAISYSIPLFVDTLRYYDAGSVYIPGTPKDAGEFKATNNPGLPINWGLLNKPIGTIDTVTVKKGEQPDKPVGYYSFNDVPEGEYILEVSRKGYLTRYAKITISRDAALGHREILGGDVNSTRLIDGADFSLLIANYSNYGTGLFNSRYDLNGDKVVDGNDLNILLYNTRGSFRIYKESNDWLTE